MLWILFELFWKIFCTWYDIHPGLEKKIAESTKRTVQVQDISSF